MSSLSIIIVILLTLNTPKFPSETQWCQDNGQRYLAIGIDERLPDGTRCDFITKTHAIEVDWADGLKPFEAIGQALYYSKITRKRAGIILLIKDGTRKEEEDQWKRIYRCMIAISGNNPPIDLWTEKVFPIIDVNQLIK